MRPKQDERRKIPQGRRLGNGSQAMVGRCRCQPNRFDSHVPGTRFGCARKAPHQPRGEELEAREDQEHRGDAQERCHPLREKASQQAA